MKRLILLTVLCILPVFGASGQTATETAVFAGGCFWCVEEAFDSHEGVLATTSGFSGGHVPDPSYRQVVNGGTGHIEVVQVEFDPRRISYEQLLYVYWRNIDPFDADGQFCDRGHAYTSAIFYLSEAQRSAAERTRDKVQRRFSREVATDVRPFEVFYPAEEYHQGYYRKNPIRYRFYRTLCGRYNRLNEIWGDETSQSWQDMARKASSHVQLVRVDGRPLVTTVQEYDVDRRVIHGERRSTTPFPVQLSEQEWRMRLPTLPIVRCSVAGLRWWIRFPVRIWGMCSTTGLNQPDNATALMVRR